MNAFGRGPLVVLAQLGLVLQLPGQHCRVVLVQQAARDQGVVPHQDRVDVVLRSANTTSLPMLPRCTPSTLFVSGKACTSKRSAGTACCQRLAEAIVTIMLLLAMTDKAATRPCC